MAEKRHVIGGNDGWLKVKREPGGEIVALPEYLQVEFSHSKDGRDFFKALEGGEQGKAFSVKQGNLKPGLPVYRPAAHIEFTVTAQKLTFPEGSVKAITAEGARAVAVGIHPIQIPDFPHELGSLYLSQSWYAKNWFYLGRGAAIPGNNDRYLHTGRRTGAAMEKLSARLLFGTSLCLAIVGSTAEVGVAQDVDLRDPQAVAKALRSAIDRGQKVSAEQAFSLGVKYRTRAIKDGNWGPAAKAFGESALLYPRSLTLKEYAESSLRAQSRVAAANGLDEQLAVLEETIDLYRSALAADDVLRELTQDQRVELVQRRDCAQRFLQRRNASSPCQPLQWIGLAR